MKILMIFVIGLISSQKLEAAQPKKCCVNAKNLMKNNTCVPDATSKSLKITLTCEEKYILDPDLYEDDAFNITADGSLYAHDPVEAVLLATDE